MLLFDDYGGNNSQTENEYLAGDSLNCTKVSSVEAYFVNVTCIPAIVITMLLSFFQLRKSCKLDCCGGRPAVTYPVNLVEDHERRWVYAAGFGVIAYKVLRLFDGNYFWQPAAFKDEEWMKRYGFSKVFIGLLNIMQICFIYYPVLACVVFRRSIAANILGFLYTSSWAIMSILMLLSCTPVPNSEDGLNQLFEFIFDIPVYVCYLVLLSAYVWDLVINLRSIRSKRFGWEYTVNTLTDDPHPEMYVRSLLQRQPVTRPGKFFQRIKYKLTYKKVPGFKYSVRVICTMTVAAFGLYRLGVGLGAVVDGYLDELIANLEAGKGFFEFSGTNDTYNHLLEILSISKTTFMVCNTASLIFHVFFMVHMVVCYREHLLKYLKGNRHWHHEFQGSATPSTVLVSCFRYSGAQIAFIIYGWFILLSVAFLKATLLTYFIILPLRDGYSNIVIDKVKELWPTLVISLLLLVVQRLLAKYVFLQNNGAYLALDNRRLFHVLDYILFFLNVLVGFFTALRRVAFSVILGTLLVSRLDRVLLMRGFERMDSGFNAYLGMLTVELHQNHPVLRLFVQHLLEAVPLNRPPADTDISLKGQMSRNKERARRRWFKAVTLINNPSLVVERLRKLVRNKTGVTERLKMDANLLDTMNHTAFLIQAKEPNRSSEDDKHQRSEQGDQVKVT